MFRVGQGLELARTFLVPWAEFRIWFPGFGRHGGEEFALCVEKLVGQSSGDARCFNAWEIYVRGDVLFARVGENIGALFVLAVGAEGSVGTFGQEGFCCPKAVIEG